jgi:hypothetical protein
MTTIILTIIGILLAAAAALMVIFYGGDAFNSGSVGAQANTYQNAGTNVIAATQLYRADGNTDAPTVAKLQSLNSANERYLAEDPALPNGIKGTIAETATDSGKYRYSVAVADTKVCARINSNLKVVTSGAGAQTIDTVKMGCFGGNFVANL